MTDPILAYEQATAQALSARLRRRLVRASRQITATYIQLAGGLDQPMPLHRQGEFVARVQRILQRVALHLGGQLLRAIGKGIRMGVRDTRAAVGQVGRGRPRLPADLQTEAATLDFRVRRDLADAADLARRVRTWDDAVTVIGRANQADTRVQRVARYSANRAVAYGVQAVTDSLGVARIWLPERDACLHCLAYAGQIAQPGGFYRGGLTYYLDPSGRPKPLGLESVPGPPLHPFCRCQQQPWMGSQEGVGDTELPQVLRREAQRSVARGDAGASEPARLRAADAMLRHPTLLPTSVQRRARRAVQAGSFG